MLSRCEGQDCGDDRIGAYGFCNFLMHDKRYWDTDVGLLQSVMLSRESLSVGVSLGLAIGRICSGLPPAAELVRFHNYWSSHREMHHMQASMARWPIDMLRFT